MDEIGLPTKEIVRLLETRQGFRLLRRSSRIQSLGRWPSETSKRILWRRFAQANRQEDFRVSVSLDRYTKMADEKGMWWIFLKAKFGLARRADRGG
jgi:hypothetical protein